MKKLLLIATSATISLSAIAQKSEIRNARNALSDKDFPKAQKSIDAAVANPETQNDPNAWLTRSVVYILLQQQPGNDAQKYYQEAGKSLKKVIELKPTYEKDDVNKKLLAVAQYNLNDGIKAFDKQTYTESYNYFKEVVDIHELDGGQRFANNKTFDTIARQATAYEAYSAYYSQQYDNALPLLQKIKNDPIVKDPRNYIMIADIYEVKNDDANLLATINEGKAAYPKDQSITNRELNYYASKGKMDAYIGKVEDAVKADPNNAELLFNLATAYNNIANPKDKSGKDLPKPANYNELFAKAETAYENTTKAAPQKAEVFYYYGALYFNRGVSVNNAMNELGNSAADIKKFDGMKIERDEWFNKAVKQFESAIAIWEPQAKSLKGDDLSNYQTAIIQAKEIYARNNNMQKATELKKKLDALQ